MKLASLETLFCDAGWRPWIFVKATADDGSVGWAEVTIVTRFIIVAILFVAVGLGIFYAEWVVGRDFST